MSTELHLVSLELDAQRLHAFARSSGQTNRDIDDGYAVHAALAALFDNGAADTKCAPKPFRVVDPNRRVLRVLGYAGVGHEVLAERARLYANPSAWGLTSLESMASRPVPSVFREKQRLGFDVLLCPVRRVARRGNQRDERAEVDAFLAKSWESENSTASLDREAVYREWLGAEVSKNNAARLTRARMERFQLQLLHRRTQGERRKGARVEHPVVQFSGEFEVMTPVAFYKLLARGVGRHRAFGFGMLLLRPPS